MLYPTFTVKDFCKDPAFIRWVTDPTPELIQFWEEFMLDYPQKIIDIQLATNYVSTIRFAEIDPSPKDLARLKKRIWADIDQQSVPVIPMPGRVLGWYRQPYWAAAAVLLLVSAIGLGWWKYQANAALTYQTAYGKIQEIRLADGSIVTLNANSSLKVANHIDNSSTREVWLKGEAYFDIAKRQGSNFIVHTPGVQVEVLGTEFNVNTRREQTNVVLHEGKVQLRAYNQLAVVMKPGDMATVIRQSRHIALKKVEPDVYDAWKESYIVLDGQPLSEIVATLEDTFGVTINLADAQLANKKLTGKLRTEVADDCIENLAIIIEADVTKTGNTYRFVVE